ncbi:hypothetical protein V6N13_095327 [Hibiscus sabdariffa]
MAGGGSRRDEGSLAINSTNVFAALDTLRKKKKSDKDRGSSKRSSSKSQQPQKETDPQVFWAPAPLNVKSWADVDDDDDYFAMTAPQSVWGSSEPSQSHEDKNIDLEDSESEEDILDEGDDVEEEHDHEPEVQVHPEPVQEKAPEVPAPPKEAERQLSKKERKKKELAELEALLADFGVAQNERDGHDESHEVEQEKKDDGGKKENPLGESKSAKKKKKKEKSKEAKESHEQPTSTNFTNVPDEDAPVEQTEDDASTVDMKERLRKMASMKKKKSSKEMDAAAKAAAQEAAARNAKLAAAKKKEKNHYNQQPARKIIALRNVSVDKSVKSLLLGAGLWKPSESTLFPREFQIDQTVKRDRFAWMRKCIGGINIAWTPMSIMTQTMRNWINHLVCSLQNKLMVTSTGSEEQDVLSPTEASIVRQLKDSEMAMQWTLIYKLTSRL